LQENAITEDTELETDSTQTEPSDSWNNESSALSEEVSADQQIISENESQPDEQIAAVPLHQPTVSKSAPTWSDQRKKPKNYSNRVVMHYDRGGKIAEEYRALRTNLLARYGQDKFCFVVTSAEPGEGKTLTCLNLGLAMAERLDKKTIIVDCNLRNKRAAELLSVHDEPGMTELIKGTSSFEETVQPTLYPNLFFLPAGNPENSEIGGLIGRTEISEIISKLRKNYDYVLIDSPSINHFSDAGMLGFAVGEALLVARMNKTSKDAIERAVQNLKSLNVGLVGMLLTHRKKSLLGS
jgi:capsular exopolysaccharide synthesis family protein